jgi:hypothetical protein
MNKKIGLIGGVVAACIAGILMMNSCGDSGSSDPWEAVNPYDDNKLADNVEAYYDATLGYSASTDRVFDVYTEMSIDFGYMAYQMKANQDFANSTFSKMITNGKIQYYKIEKSGVAPGVELSSAQSLFKTVANPTSYKAEGVKIDAGFNKIIQNDRPALMITDFEQWDGDQDYSKTGALYGKLFKKWLEKPNHTITLYYAKFCDAPQDDAGRKKAKIPIIKQRNLKKIFFAYFDVDKDKSFSMMCAPDAGKRKGFKSECIDAAPFKVKTKYANLSSSGLGMGLEKQVTKVVQGLKKNKTYEFINVGKYNWEFINKTITTNKSEPFLKNLFLDASNKYAVNLADLDVRVYDVTSDFEQFVKCKYAAGLKPKLKDKNGKSVLADDNDAITKEVYVAETGKLKDAYVYKKKSSFTTIEEIFALNKLLFKNTMTKSNLKKIKIETKVHSAFSLDKIKQKNGLMRVDIVAKVKTKGSSSFNNLTWRSVGRNKPCPEYDNECLKLSVSDALQGVSTEERVIYTYYIRVLPTKE